MPPDDTKSKIVSFRLSTDEYNTVEAVSRVSGFASVSLFARSATLTCNSAESIHTAAKVDVYRVWQRLEALTLVFEQTVRQLRLSLDCTDSPETVVFPAE
jgi:hypothetical protein